MDEFNSTRTGKSVRVEEPVYPERVRSTRKGKEDGSLITIVYTLVSVTLTPPAVVPVAVTVMLDVPARLGVPMSIPVAELRESPVPFNPVAEKEPDRRINLESRNICVLSSVYFCIWLIIQTDKPSKCQSLSRN